MTTPIRPKPKQILSHLQITNLAVVVISRQFPQKDRILSLLSPLLVQLVLQPPNLSKTAAKLGTLCRPTDKKVNLSTPRIFTIHAAAVHVTNFQYPNHLAAESMPKAIHTPRNNWRATKIRPLARAGKIAQGAVRVKYGQSAQLPQAQRYT